MNKTTLIIIVLLVVALAGYWWYSQRGEKDLVPDNFGSYAYQCDNGAHFTMTPSADIASVTITPGMGASFAAATLAATSSTAGAAYVGTGMSFIGAGEEIDLTVGGTKMVCNPVPNPDEAPFNWGDAGEGAGAAQNAAAAVATNIVGTWRSTDDSKFTRTFNADGTAVDAYTNTPSTKSFWTTFSAENPPETAVAFPLEAGATYVQMLDAGTSNVLNFKVATLTPETLQLIYMDRGGALNFARVR